MTKITGFVCSSWDLMHPGRIHLLDMCSNQCDLLLVGLHSDPSIERTSKTKPIQSMFERWYQLNATLLALNVDHVIVPYDTEQDLRNILTMNDIGVRFLGDDYIDKPYTGDDLDISVIYFDRSHGYSGSELRQRILDNGNLTNKNPNGKCICGSQTSKKS